MTIRQCVTYHNGLCGTLTLAWTRKYYLKNNYLTFRSKVKVPRRSFWYGNHRLMVMHPHTKYNWPIWKERKVMVVSMLYMDFNYVSPSNEGRHIGLVWFFLLLLLLLLLSEACPDHNFFFFPDRSIIFALWSYTHIPYIIDLSRKIKMLWSRQENTI
jgi:hypothetical protein